jgi:hypothetical protein
MYFCALVPWCAQSAILLDWADMVSFEDLDDVIHQFRQRVFQTSFTIFIEFFFVSYANKVLS